MDKLQCPQCRNTTHWDTITTSKAKTSATCAKCMTSFEVKGPVKVEAHVIYGDLNLNY